MNDLVHELPGGILLIDAANLIAMVNVGAEQHLGYDPGELVGKPFSQILTLASRMFVQTHFYPLLDLNGRVDEVALTLVNRTGEHIPILLNANLRTIADVRKIQCVYLPISRRHIYESEIIQARKKAEEAQITILQSEARYRALAQELEVRVADRTRELSQANQELGYLNADLKRSNDNLQQFAFIASHDLQEPLRKIQTFSDLLKNKYADSLGEGIEFLERMQTAARRMSTLIGDLLIFSRITTQQDISESVSLTVVVNNVLLDLDLYIQETGARVSVCPLPTIAGDPSQLGQLFTNLLSNAIKFSRKDQSGAAISPQILIEMKQRKINELPPRIKPTRLANAYYQIDISDNGIGFDEKYLTRIFQVFQRLHGKNEFAGTGIGLAICEKVVANHGGAITATSQLGIGSTFSLFLPI